MACIRIQKADSQNPCLPWMKRKLAEEAKEKRKWRKN